MKGSRGPEIKCFAYDHGPMRTAHDSKNRTEPTDHLQEEERVSNEISRTDSGDECLGVRRRL